MIFKIPVYAHKMAPLSSSEVIMKKEFPLIMKILILTNMLKLFCLSTPTILSLKERMPPSAHVLYEL